MPRFFLLDHSLQSMGGHHFDYAMQSLRAAERAGYEIVLVSHRKFARHFDPPSHWRFFSPFRFNTYGPYTIHVSSRSQRGAAGKRWRDRLGQCAGPLRSLWRSLDRRRRLTHFANACRQVFRQCPAEVEDIVFLPTLSEFDLLGLAEYLRGDEATRKPSWHLQFHFNVFEGREPEYAAQANRAARVRRVMHQPLSELRQHRLHLYATCEPLARQFNLLEMAHFEALTYPIDPAISVSSELPFDRPASRPLRLTCAGAIRQEKGQQQLSDLALRLSGFFKEGQVKLVVQSNKSWFRLPTEELAANEDRHPAETARPIANSGLPNAEASPVEYVGHPLSPQEYAALIRNASIGLLLYDSRRYYARRAGVMGEYLAAGVPVVAPAACWLSEQLAEVNANYLNGLCAGDEPLEMLASAAVLHIPATRKAQEFTHLRSDSAPKDGVIEFPVHALDAGDNLIARFRWNDLPACPGAYIGLSIEQYSDAGTLIASSKMVCGQISSDAFAMAMCRLNPLAATVRASFRDEYQSTQHVLADVQFLKLPSPTRQHQPLGVVGLTFADASQVAPAVQDIIENFDHYRNTAIEFAAQWMEQHSPNRTISQLVANGESSRPGAVNSQRPNRAA